MFADVVEPYTVPGLRVLPKPVATSERNIRQLGRSSQTMLNAALFCKEINNPQTEQGSMAIAEYNDLFHRHLFIETMGETVRRLETNRHTEAPTLASTIYDDGFWNNVAKTILEISWYDCSRLSEEERTLVDEWCTVIKPMSQIVTPNADICSTATLAEREYALITKCSFTRRIKYKNRALYHAMIYLIEKPQAQRIA